MNDTERKAYGYLILAIVAASYAWALLGCPGVWDAMKGVVL
jgi:hypothetical protein